MMDKKNHGFSPKSLPQRRSEGIRRSNACRTSENPVKRTSNFRENPFHALGLIEGKNVSALGFTC